MARAKKRRRTRLRGAVRTCIDWKRVRVKGGKTALRCKRFYEGAGCPDEYGHRKGYAECVGGTGSRAGRRRFAKKYPVVARAR